VSTSYPNHTLVLDPPGNRVQSERERASCGEACLVCCLCAHDGVICWIVTNARGKRMPSSQIPLDRLLPDITVFVLMEFMLIRRPPTGGQIFRNFHSKSSSLSTSGITNAVAPTKPVTPFGLSLSYFLTPARNSQLLLPVRPHTGHSTMTSIDSLTAPFFDNPLYSDIIIKFGEHQLHAHKVILAQQSGYFATAFFSRFQVNQSQNHRRRQTDATRLHQALSSIWVTKTIPSCLRM
jgi:hypothetical protein